MASLHVPRAGLSLSHKPRSGTLPTGGPTQVLRLDLNETVKNDILWSLRNSEPARLRLGKKTVAEFGNKKISLQTHSDAFPSELYAKTSDDEATLYFSGRLSHTLEVQKAQNATAKSDEALAALESTLKSMQEQRANNETSFVRNRDEMKHLSKKDHRASSTVGTSSAIRKDHLLGTSAISTPASPHVGAPYSPRHGPTSAPLLGGTTKTSKDRIRQEAIKIPLLHILASRPMTTRAISDMLHAPREECEKVLDKIARDCKGALGKKELKEKSFKELEVWKFSYRTQEERQNAIDHAIHAFDRLRIEKKDLLWQMLLPVDERGKGKTLSRLNFDKPAARPSTPKPEGRLGDDLGDTKAGASDVEGAKARPRKKDVGVKTTDKSTQQKKVREKEPSSRTPTRGRVSGDQREKVTTKSSKTEEKFKSSARIEDSDEEAEAAAVVIAKPEVAVKRKQLASNNTPGQSPQRVASPARKKQLHKSHLSTSSSNSEVGDKTVHRSFNTDLKPVPENSSRVSPRPRTDSSPQKPSPLGSSPPTNSTDVDSSSSSKAPSQSSAPSSPPSSTDMPLAKKGNKYSPVISEKHHDVSRGRSPVKRKSDSMGDEPPTKRQQVNGSQHIMLVNGISDPAQRLPLERKTSDSERSSSPDKAGLNREGVMGDAKRFQKYYTKYKDLHDKIAGVPENARDDKDMNDLWKMHKRLKEMKAEIWDNWDKVEKSPLT